MRIRGRPIYYGWYVLAAVSGINFANGATTIGVLTVFIIPFTDEFGWTRTQIAAATSIGALLGAAAAPFTGRLTDRLGARIPLAIGGLLVVAAALNLAAMQTLVWFYLAFGVARLADQGFLQPPSPPAIARWFLRYRGRAMAVLFFTTSAGGVVLPLSVQFVIDAWDWRMAWVMLAGVMFFVGFLPTVLLVRRQPEDMGLPIDGEVAPATAAPPSTASVMATPPDDLEEQWQLAEAIRNGTLWLLLASIFAIGIVGAGVTLHLVPYLVQQGLDPAAAVGAVSMSFLAAGAANLLWGFLAERFSTRYLLVGTYLLKILSVAVLLMVNAPPLAYLYAIMHGFTEGGLRTLTAILLADYYGRQNLGSIFGISRSVQVAGFAIGPLVSGAAFDLTQSYDNAFAFFFILSIIGTALILIARRPSKRVPA